MVSCNPVDPESIQSKIQKCYVNSLSESLEQGELNTRSIFILIQIFISSFIFVLLVVKKGAGL